MPPHPLTNFEIQKYYQKEPKFKEEMYSTMNSYYKYASILKPAFNKINILHTAHQYWGKVSKIFHTLCLYLWLPAIMNLIFRTMRLENFMALCRDKLYYRTICN